MGNTINPETAAVARSEKARLETIRAKAIHTDKIDWAKGQVKKTSTEEKHLTSTIMRERNLLKKYETSVASWKKIAADRKI